ncbi:sodium:alanine symporter family protein [Parvibaculum sp.]|uniref:alanine/glycine:cation symporter family protein n=1 Tax=Parvibaculum sp. TaxID=2024848 RepID=UPI00272FA1AD|nr:sodium:alanine symporter family protein [Parvibaculum sp.]MDP1626342.1 sodium:alanine symporter family protein [Parvibaculum sp.]MDP2151267.1 sodium:alanine symporter family protein [Parvibaculum sp.]MDP3327108.1 sodium:alanine symporter family protein [Parvibaculum sp.]
MQATNDFINALNNILWGWPMLIALAATGVFLTIGLRFVPWRKLPEALALSVRPSKGAGDISPFQALMTALAATVGTGNIAGVATAIYFGGPGALFYMWVIALVGMATKYTEAVLAVAYREVDELGNHVGGPMYYIKNGVGAKFPTLALILAPAFAIFTALAGFGIGNGVQANSVAHALNESFGVPVLVSGLAMMVLVGLVLVGGIRRIGEVASALVPTMIVLYVGTAVVILAINYAAIPAAFALVFQYAFTPGAVEGGAIGASVMLAIRWGFARGIFSNEAGLGSAAIAHAAAKTDDPIQQGLVGMVGVFIDTLVVCTLTGLVIITSGLWAGGLNGAALTSAAFGSALPWGAAIVAASLALFAFTTLLGWSYYGERAVEFLFGIKAIWPYRIVWVLAIPFGAATSLDLVWNMADALNAMMALPNLIALFILAPAVFAMTRNYWAKS